MNGRFRRSGLAVLGLAVALMGCMGDAKRFPTSKNFPATMMNRTSFTAGGGHPWRLSALRTPRNAPWKVVIITGTPSWSEYWAPTLAALPKQYTMIVTDRPGFAMSEPKGVVGKISEQAEALSPLLDAEPGQRVILVGQSYGAPIASEIAAAHPDKVAALILMSAFFGERGATADKLTGLGAWVGPVLPRDLKNSLAEVKGQAPQLPAARAALAGLKIPVIILHGDSDTFVPPAAAKRLADTGHSGGPTRYINVPGGDHFLNACCVPALIGALDEAVGMVAK